MKVVAAITLRSWVSCTPMVKTESVKMAVVLTSGKSPGSVREILQKNCVTPGKSHQFSAVAS